MKNNLMEAYEKETGKDSLWQFSPTLEYVEWLEAKLNEVGQRYCDAAEKYAFYDKTGQFYYRVLELIGKSFAQKLAKLRGE